MGILNNSIVTDADTEILDGEIDQISNYLSETHYFDNEQKEELELLVAKAMKLGELYERKKWQAAKAQVVPKWISVEDKLPELKEHTWRTALPVNVMIDGYGQYLCYPCQDGNGVFYWADATCYGNDKGEHPIKCDRDTEVLNVTHWMPLPDAPQEPAND